MADFYECDIKISGSINNKDVLEFEKHSIQTELLVKIPLEESSKKRYLQLEVLRPLKDLDLALWLKYSVDVYVTKMFRRDILPQSQE
jgi:hypothetical protein